MTEDEQEKNYNDEVERRQFNDFKVGTRRSPLSNNVLLLLGDVLQPQTTGYNHINMDMSFTQLDDFDMYLVDNSSFLITYCQLYGFKKALFLERNKLATRLVSKRSLGGKSMDMFTHTVTEHKQKYQENVNKKTGFNWIFKGKQKNEEQ